MADHEPTESNVPTRRRRILRGLGILAVVLCVLVIVALIAVHTPPVRRYVANQVVALLAREQIEFSTDELGYNVLNASINLRNVRIRSTIMARCTGVRHDRAPARSISVFCNCCEAATSCSQAPWTM